MKMMKKTFIRPEVWLTVFEGQDILAASFTGGDGPKKTVNVFYEELEEASERDEEGVYQEELTKMKQRFIKAHDGHIIVVDATEGPMPETREQISAARRKNLSNLVVVLNICDSDFDDEEMLELEELEMRELLDEYGYDGDNTPIIRVSNFEEYSRQEQSVRSTQPQNNDYSESLNKREKADNFYEEDDDKYFDKQAIFEEKLGEDRMD